MLSPANIVHSSLAFRVSGQAQHGLQAGSFAGSLDSAVEAVMAGCGILCR